MKILYHHRIASKDGQYVHVEEIINALKRQGHDVILVAPDVAQHSDFGSDGGWMSTLRSALPQFIAELLEFGYAFLAFFKLCIAIKKHRPDAMYERYNLFLPAGIWAKSLFRLPFVLEVNSPLYKERKKYGGLALGWLAKWSEHYTWRHADHVLPVTQVLANYIKQAGVPDERITVIPNGIDPSRFGTSVQQPREQRFLDKTVVGFVGFCREWHHLDKVLDLIAAQHNPNLMLLIIGDGPVINDLKSQALKLGMAENFYSTGLVERDQMPYWLAQIDIALQPAVTPWASPLKLLEYMASGKAIIAPNTPNIGELLEDGQNGLLFDEKTQNITLLQCVERLIQDPELTERLGKAARKTVVQRELTWDSNTTTITHLLSAQGARSSYVQ
ncbi:glycosyltransferase [Vibrio sp. CAIM 722]|uniref:Glycosyltransferase n=1 Tax=Vibrio eleionomae TaxID=2653505 RepID=A0A7X4RWC7_9VIBR|nr:glycosyltransferase family 4 protein [Vibrio eleionomae]MZI95543.1 glycosyltransferase [Vibrio eleionomae]